jgi:hypothetical protein
VALVEVIARADRRVLRAKSLCQVKVALEADFEWDLVEVREREHLALHLEDRYLLAEREIFDSTRLAETASM